MTDPIPLDRLVACAERELAMRRRVYPRRVADKKMTQENADWETQCQAHIVAKLKWLLRYEQPIRELIERRLAMEREARENPAVALVLEAFPDADVSVDDSTDRESIT